MSLEQLRSTHEELEVYHEVLLHELSRHPRSKRQIVFQDHKLSNVGQSANKRAKLLVQLHQDKHQLLANECKELQDRQQRFTKFYQELQDINQFHASNVDLAGASLPSLISNNDAPLKNKIPPLLHVGVATGESNLELFSELDIPDSGDALVTFSGEEYFGRFVDLHTFFSRYKNLPKTNHQEITYEQYVENIFYDFSIFTSDTKSQRRYSKYITELLEYIDSFVQRTRPLSKQAEWKTEQMKTFNNAWSKGKIENWTNGQPNEITNLKQEKEDKETTTQVDLKQYKNAVDMEVLGMDVLKAELMARGVKCGGTIRDRSDRLYSIRDLNTKDIPKHLKAKKKRIKRTRGGKKESNNSATTNSSSTTTTSTASSTSTNQLLAMNEYFLMQRSTTTLKNEIVDTLRHLERKRTRTHEEMQREMEDELKRDDEEGADGTSALRKGDGNDSDEDNNDMLYNPKGKYIKKK